MKYVHMLELTCWMSKALVMKVIIDIMHLLCLVIAKGVHLNMYCICLDVHDFGINVVILCFYKCNISFLFWEVSSWELGVHSYCANNYHNCALLIANLLPKYINFTYIHTWHAKDEGLY
jgi:hypothetical protein